MYMWWREYERPNAGEVAAVLYYVRVFGALEIDRNTIIRPDCCVYDNFSGNIENETPCAAAGEMLFYIIVPILLDVNVPFISPAVTAAAASTAPKHDNKSYSW